jgi:hypothetical protein
MNQSGCMERAHAIEIISYSIDDLVYRCLQKYFSAFSEKSECFTSVALILMRDALKANVLRVLSLEQNINPADELQYCVALLEFRSQHRPQIERFFTDHFRRHRLHVRLSITPQERTIQLGAQNAFALFEGEKNRITAKLEQAQDFKDVFSFFEESNLLQKDDLRDQVVACLNGMGVNLEAYCLHVDAPAAKSELTLPLQAPIAPGPEKEIFDFRS